MLRIIVPVLIIWVTLSVVHGQVVSITEPERVFIRPTGLDIPVNQIVKDRDGYLWIGTVEGLFRYDGFDFERLGDDPELGQSLSQSNTAGLYVDSLNNLWIGTTNALHLLSARRDKILTYDLQPAMRKDAARNNVFSEESGHVWFANNSNVVLRFKVPDHQQDTLAPDLMFHHQDKSLESVHVWEDSVLIMAAVQEYIIADTAGNILDVERLPFRPQTAVQVRAQNKRRMAITGGEALYLMDPVTLQPGAVLNYPGIQYFQPIYWLTPSDADRGIWIGGLHGTLWKYHFTTGQLLDYSSILDRKVFDEQFERTQTGLQGSEKVFWVGTSTGLFKINTPASRNFEILEKPPDNQSSRTFSTRGMLWTADGNLLVGGYKGMFKYDQAGRFLKQYLAWGVDSSWTNPIAYQFLQDGDSILIASEGNGLLSLNPRVDSVRKVELVANPQGINDVNAFNWSLCLERDVYGLLWIGTIRGVFIVDDWHVLRRFELAGNSLLDERIYDILQAPDSTLWLATSSGLFSINPERSEIRQHDIAQSPATAINTLALMPEGELCIGTRGEGLVFYSPEHGVRTRIDERHGLADAVVCGIEEGTRGELWVSTNDGITSIDSTHRDIQSYSVADGLPHDEFNHSSCLRAPDGTLYFGTVDGVVFFDPRSDSLLTEQQGRLRVSKMYWHDGKQGMTRHAIFQVGDHPGITLTHHDKYFSVHYSSTHIEEVADQEYVYMLAGLHEDWQQNGRKNFVQITGLSPGRYTLLIRTTTTSDRATDRILAIPVVVEQAWFKTWSAIVMYILVAAALILLLVRDLYRRIHLRRQLQLELDHSMRLEEINKAKSTFFTNITHEFKTPLTLIQGPAEEIQQQSKDPQLQRYAKLISRNATSILNLVTQLLDLNKLEANLDKPQFYRLDLVAYLRQWVDKFTPLAEQQNVDLKLRSGQREIYIDFDPVKLEKVFSNLLSNALKFTPENGKVLCVVEGFSTDPDSHREMISLSVKDTGRGIDSTERAHIFERFYQGKDSVQGGTGIGLAFVRELVRLHDGVVKLDDDYRHGACFRVFLPVYQDNVIEGLRPGGVSAEAMPSAAGNGALQGEPGYTDTQAVVLIAEDHDDVASLVSDTLGAFCKTYTAPNGRVAFEQAVTLVPDLIITDVMMPVMDGFTLTHQLKNDVHTSHIPIVMLTAKGTQEDRINGRRHGADVFISKPFSTTELQYTVRNLLHLREQLLQKSSDEAHENVHNVKLSNNRDKEFYSQFLQIVGERLSDSSLQVQDLLNALGMSRTQLHRKVKAITGQSANQLIRGMRLQKGLSLLKKSGKNISEIAYEVGFTSPSYFSESFKEYYGYTPSEAVGRDS